MRTACCDHGVFTPCVYAGVLGWGMVGFRTFPEMELVAPFSHPMVEPTPTRRGTKRRLETPSETPFVDPVALAAIASEVACATDQSRLRAWRSALAALAEHTNMLLDAVRAREREVAGTRKNGRAVAHFVAEIAACRPGTALACLRGSVVRATGAAQLARFGATAHVVALRIKRAEFSAITDEDGQKRVGLFTQNRGVVTIETPLPPDLQLHSKAVQRAVMDLVARHRMQTLYDASRSGVQVKFDCTPGSNLGQATFSLNVHVVLRRAVHGVHE